jgi:hypothetical protein
MIQKLARYWETEYDWRECGARLNALPHFITEIDELDIHLIHVGSQHEDALPLVVNHGSPGSIIGSAVVDRLTNPTAHGASAADAFHLVVPSMPGSNERMSVADSTVLLMTEHRCAHQCAPLGSCSAKPWRLRLDRKISR